MYTPHGHHIPGTTVDPPFFNGSIARCGGPGLCKECSQYQVHLLPHVTPEGVWFVYFHDTGAQPLFMHPDELVARRWADTNGYGDTKFWPFGKSWDEIKNDNNAYVPQEVPDDAIHKR